MDKRTVGILGGGQLGRMMIESAHKLGIRIAVLDPLGPSSPAGQLSHLCIEGSFQDANKIKELSVISDVITTEIEHVNTDELMELEKSGVVIHPNPQTLRIIQDKYAQKVYLSDNGISLPDFMNIPDVQAGVEAGLRYGYPFMMKNKRLAYDGRGNAVVRSADDVPIKFSLLGSTEIYAERFVPFVKELAAMIVRTKDGILSYPVVETIQLNNVCHIVTAPAQISSMALQAAERLARQAISSLDGYGIYGVEMFLLNDDTVLLNEIAPRPHNSGHYTIEACEIDQFEMHLRAVLQLPCPTPKLRVGCAMMINVLGGDSMEATKSILHKALNVSGSSIHWYGKNENRVGRKMAHVTVTAIDFNSLRERVEALGVTQEVHGIVQRAPRVGVIMGSDSDLPTMKDAVEILELFEVSHEVTIVSAHRTPTRMYSYAQSAAERGIEVIIAGAGGAAHLPGMVASLTSLPVVGVPIKTSILSGNDSLLSIVQMPKGIPVATVAIGNAANAGLLAVRILAAQDRRLLERMDQYLIKQEEEVLRKASKLETKGYKAYLAGQL